jgi:hypothetical protein
MPEEIKSRVLSLRKELPDDGELLYGSNISSALAQGCWLSKSLADLASMEASTTSSLAELTGGRLISCFFGFQPAAYRITPLDSRDSVDTFLILLDTPELAIPSENFSLFINGQKTSSLQGMYAFYQRRSDNLEEGISLSGYYFNRLTGERGNLFATDSLTVQIE